MHTSTDRGPVADPREQAEAREERAARILHVAEVAHGGVISVVGSFARGQIESGHDVHVLVPDGVEMPGVTHTWNPQRRRPHEYPAQVDRLRRVVDEVRPDVLHLHSFFSGLFGRLAARRLSAAPAVVYQPHAWAFEAARVRPLARAVAAWERHAARRTDLLVVNCTDELVEARQRRICDSAAVVGVPVDVRHFVPATESQRERLRQRLGLGSRFVVVCVGRVSRQKGQDQLVAHWDRHPIPHAELVLVGPGDTAALQELAPREWGRTIHAVGSQTDVRPWLQAADVCVQPSRYEGQSAAVAEAMACGTPVVMTHVNGACDALLPAGRAAAGAVVPRGDMNALLQAVRVRLGSRQRDEEAVAARQRAVQHFATEKVLARLEQAYQRAGAVDRAGEVGSR